MVEQAMRKSEVLALLREHKPVLAERFGVGDLALFGSIVRDEAGPDSDVDILVTLPNARGWSGYGEVLQCCPAGSHRDSLARHHGTRNRIVHGYGSIREQIVWEIVSDDVPELIPQLRALLQEAEGQDDAHAS